MSTTTNPTSTSRGSHNKPPTERQIEAVRLRDQGKSNVEIGRALGIQPGAAGNLVTDGLRRMGRESEIGQSAGGGSRKAVPRTPVDVIEAELGRIDDKRQALKARVQEATRAAKAKDEQIVEALREQFADQVTKLEAELKAVQEEAHAFSQDPTPYVNGEREKRTAHAARVQESVKPELDMLDQAFKKNETARDALKALEQ